MIDCRTIRRRGIAWASAFAAWIALGLIGMAGTASAAQAPKPAKPPAPGTSAEPAAAPKEMTPEERKAALADAARRAAADTSEAGEAKQAGGEEEAAPRQPPTINYLDLMVRGGWLMIPILFTSLVVVTFGVERMLALRRAKVLPPELIDGLGTLAGKPGGLEPRAAYRLCQKYPSAAANVIRAMLLKVGRPHTEVEHAVTEANDREAARLYSNVRWLSLAAGVSPLLGLLGTVLGMIQAFFATANLDPGQNKAQTLANGIYVALVTTFAGLSVAIPAAILAHVFESRIQGLFRELDETLLGLLPQLERYEGRLRVSRDQFDRPAAEPPAADKPPREQPAAAPK